MYIEIIHNDDITSFQDGNQFVRHIDFLGVQIESASNRASRRVSGQPKRRDHRHWFFPLVRHRFADWLPFGPSSIRPRHRNRYGRLIQKMRTLQGRSLASSLSRFVSFLGLVGCSAACREVFFFRLNPIRFKTLLIVWGHTCGVAGLHLRTQLSISCTSERPDQLSHMLESLFVKSCLLSSCVRFGRHRSSVWSTLEHASHEIQAHSKHFGQASKASLPCGR
jgi:hypothetical protein